MFDFCFHDWGVWSKPAMSYDGVVQKRKCKKCHIEKSKKVSWSNSWSNTWFTEKEKEESIEDS